MSGHDQRISFVIESVRQHGRLEVTGEHGSGRTFLLDDAADRLRADGWEVMVVRGVAALRGLPLAALSFGSATSARELRQSQPSVRGMYASLQDRVADGRFAILVDDWEELDSASRGVIIGVRKDSGVPLVITRLPARRFPEASDVPEDEAGFNETETLQLLPFGYDELEAIVTEHVKLPFSLPLLSRIFSKSGGNPGVALSIAKAALGSGHMESTAHGWDMKGDLWSPRMRAVMNAHLHNLPRELREGLEVLSLVGIIDIESATKLVGWETLERLEDRSLVGVIDSGPRRIVVVSPPLLAEYIRHEQPVARRIRVMELIATGLDDLSIGTASRQPTASVFFSEPDPLFIRLLFEEQSKVRAAAVANAGNAQTLESLVVEVEALIDSAADHDVIDAAFARSAQLRGDAESIARLAALHASWLARAHHDFAAAQRVIDDARPLTGQYELLLDSELAIVEVWGGSIPDDAEERLQIPSGATPIVTGRVLEALTAVRVARGELVAAGSAYARLREMKDYEIRPGAAALGVLILMFQGDFSPALELAFALHSKARERLDGNLLRAAAYATSFLLVALGNLHRARGLIDTVIAMGDAPIPLLAETYAARSTGTMLTYHAQEDPGHPVVEEMSIETELNGLLPAMHWAWPRANLLAAEGENQQAADMLWNAAQEIWQRGGRLAGVSGFLNAMEMSPDASRLDELLRCASEVEGAFVSVHLEYVTALVTRDGNDMLSAAIGLAAQGRLGIARLAFRYAEAWLEADDPVAAEAARARVAELDARTDADDYDHRSFQSTRIRLTDREIEIGHFVADGLSNPQIAEALVLSTRTVESHVYNLSKKLGATTRADFRRLLADYLAGNLIDL